MTLNDLKRYTNWLAANLLLAYAAAVVLSWTPLINRDDSDPGAWGARSGITPRTDHLTGCQYLESPHGGLTPRLDAKGRHVGCRESGGAT